MSSEHATHCTFREHPYTHLFTTSDPAGSVAYRTDLMQQVVCSPRGGELVKAVLSGEASSDVLPAAIRNLLCGTRSGSPIFASHQPGTAGDDVNTLYLLPTLECQLRCGYCRIARSQGRQAGLRLSPESACDAIDHFFGHEPDDVRRTVVFFGGEPLLVRETVFAAIRRIRGRPGQGDTDIVLQTNGIALDVHTAEFLAAHDVFVLLSIDGPAEVHDRHRTFPTGVGSYQQSVAGYNNAKRHGCRVGISATVTKETADRFVSSFPALLDDLLPDECGVGTHLHPLSAERSPHQCSPAVAARVLTEAFLAARQRGLYFQQMCQRMRPFVNGTWRRYACAACGGKIVVAPDGNAGICEYNAPEGRSYVPLKQFSASTVPDLPRWATRSPLDSRGCLQCPALPTCGGGCAYDSQVLLGDALKFDPWLCETNIEIVRWVMRDLLSHLHDSLRGQDFHVVTADERALLLGSIALDGRHVPMPRVARYGEATEAGECPAG